MKKEWSEVVVKKIALAVYVLPHGGRSNHKNRPFHGFVLNDKNSVKEYYFSDGRVMRTEGGAFFYLPKGSSYDVKTVVPGGCYAINFDAEISDEPFSIRLRDNETLIRGFRTACSEWSASSSASTAAAMRAIYDGIYQIVKECEREYMPNERLGRISVAVDAVDRNFMSPELTVESLAQLCEMSEVYFRKIFMHRFGTSPKEYIIRKRMEYARQLLASEQISVSEISALCGYGDPCHFSREFRKRFGISPKAYRS